MGMYVCIPHQEQYGLRERPAGTGHAICEICGNVDGDWEVKIPVIYTWDIQRPLFAANPKQFVLDQLVALAQRPRVKAMSEVYLLANHHEFVLGELVVPPSVSFLAITNERGLFIQERVDDGRHSGDPRGRFLPLCKYCFRLCDSQSSSYCCQECFPVQLEAILLKTLRAQLLDLLRFRVRQIPYL